MAFYQPDQRFARPGGELSSVNRRPKPLRRSYLGGRAAPVSLDEWRIHHSRGKLRTMNATDYLQHLVRELAALPKRDPAGRVQGEQRESRRHRRIHIGDRELRCSWGKQRGYIVWGVRNEDHSIVGTSFRPSAEKKGNEELENWLAIGLRPSINFRIYEGAVDGRPVALFEIPAAAHTPVRFGDLRYTASARPRRSSATTQRRSGSCGRF